MEIKEILHKFPLKEGLGMECTIC